jgi:hypothetical protein
MFMNLFTINAAKKIKNAEDINSIELHGKGLFLATRTDDPWY